MTDLELHFAPADEAVAPETQPVVPTVEAAVMNGTYVEETNGAVAPHWRAEAGRKGARRVHQLIEEGKLYEREHGLKSGRQRLRQLLELGKIYEREHGVQPQPAKKRGERLDRMEREELLSTLMQCLLRIAKPSFRPELDRLATMLQADANGQAA